MQNLSSDINYVDETRNYTIVNIWIESCIYMNAMINMDFK